MSPEDALLHPGAGGPVPCPPAAPAGCVPCAGGTRPCQSWVFFGGETPLSEVWRVTWHAGDVCGAARDPAHACVCPRSGHRASWPLRDGRQGA